MQSYLTYFRNAFGSNHDGHHHHSSPPSHGQPRSQSLPRSRGHSRSRSEPQAYPTSSPSSDHLSVPQRPNIQRSATYVTSQAPRPSPLRYPTHDGTDRYHYPRARANSSGGMRYPSFSHGTSSAYTTPGTSRSSSTTDLHRTFPITSAPVVKHVRYADERQPLSPKHGWQPTSGIPASPKYAPVNAHVYGSKHITSLNMHPLLAYTRFHHPPISYDVMYTPTTRTIVDRTTHQPIPTHMLTQPASDPPTPSSSRIMLTSEKFPWTVVAGLSDSYPRKSSSRPGSSGNGSYISNLDVLRAVHATLLTRVTPHEWDSLGHGSRTQRRVTRAYENRCKQMGGGWEGGVRRIDWLCGKTKLIGIEVDKSKSIPVGRLIFDKP